MAIVASGSRKLGRVGLAQPRFAPTRTSRLIETASAWISELPSECLLPRQQCVVDFDGARADDDRAVHAPRRRADIGEAAAAVKRLRSNVPLADLKPQPVEAKRKDILLGYRRQGRGDTPASVLMAHLHVLKLRWIRKSKVRMPERLVILPRDQIEAVALVQPGQPEDHPNPLDLVVCQSPNAKTLTWFSPIHDVSIELSQNLSQLVIS